ncbi:MAG: 7,8-didemethyl-8-hydroxy-5-deazariboflavin synthase subunit CofH [Candidatus Lokiarchaeota archaeon]|nr:7,8-didemethyl-8-hydroxy-5-deazariboflavin synthase subunit CofH [Candidatus Lokiarchaeota archaeon]
MTSNTINLLENKFKHIDPVISSILDAILDNREVSVDDAVELLKTTGSEMMMLFLTADYIREQLVGDNITFVVNRNINFTNKCRIGCKFCAFSREEPFRLSINEIVNRAIEAHEKGCTEVCIQGGINPEFKPDIYLKILKAIKDKIPDIHIHGFSPMEIYNYAVMNDLTIREALLRLKQAGLDSIPGTAAEILNDDIRKEICPNKINVNTWKKIIISAHDLNIPTTSTMMYGHIDSIKNRAEHLGILRNIQKKTKGFTEFVPLSFIHLNTPLFTSENSEVKGTTGVSDLKLYAVSRLFFKNLIKNIQVSWPKLGQKFAQFAMNVGVNDFGGTLYDENISKSAGANFGEYMPIEEFLRLIKDLNRTPAQRDTVYNILKIYK